MDSVTADKYSKENISGKLSVWEVSFLKSVQRQSKKSKDFVPSPKQAQILVGIDNKLDADYVAPKDDVVTGLTGLVDVLHTAMLTIKYPKLSFDLPDIGPIRFSVAGAKAKAPGSINITDGGSYGSNKWYGRISPAGVWEKAYNSPKGLGKFMAEMAKDSVSTITAYGKLSSKCCMCNTPITTDESLAEGYGPVCAANFGLPWGKKSVT